MVRTLALLSLSIVVVPTAAACGMRSYQAVGIAVALGEIDAVDVAPAAEAPPAPVEVVAAPQVLAPVVAPVESVPVVAVAPDVAAAAVAAAPTDDLQPQARQRSRADRVRAAIRALLESEASEPDVDTGDTAEPDAGE